MFHFPCVFRLVLAFFLRVYVQVKRETETNADIVMVIMARQSAL